jgi:nitrite reductase/ring-hydroxylating ferredoxin subunit
VTEDSRSAPQVIGDTTRRAALAGLGVAGVAVVVAACGGGSSSSGSSGSSSSGSGSSGGSSGSGTALAATSDIPVGGGKIFTSDKVVVTQPTAGEFKGFSAVCTHMGCIVDKIANGTIDCPCHGSQYSITDAHVVHGPAPRPLPTQKIKVANGKISLA